MSLELQAVLTFYFIYLPSNCNYISWVLLSHIYRWEKSIERLSPVSHRPWHLGSNSGPHILRPSTLTIKMLILTRTLAFSYNHFRFLVWILQMTVWWQTTVSAQSPRDWMKSSGESCLERKCKSVQNSAYGWLHLLDKMDSAMW